MMGGCFGEEGGSFGGMDMRNTSDIPLEWRGIRNSYIPLNRDDIRSIADIPELYAIALYIGRMTYNIMGGKNGTKAIT